ncbi:MAG: hypothetical protein MHM6MM_001818 [Cercozoa sp. M6MM]
MRVVEASVCCDGRCEVHDQDDVTFLSGSDMRIVGNYGARRRQPSLPLVLTPCEVSFLLRRRCLRLRNDQQHDRRQCDRRCRLVYAALWHRGLYVADGRKFGADFLVYDGPPQSCHASHLVHVCSEMPLPVDCIRLVRAATAVKKKVLLAINSENNEDNDDDAMSDGASDGEDDHDTDSDRAFDQVQFLQLSRAS